MDIDELIKKAEAGDAEAQYKLAVCYAKGNGVEQDYKETVKWYRKAAEQGHAQAQFCLGCAYEDGKGVKKNIAVAIKWFRKAAAQGDEEAIDALKKIRLNKPSGMQSERARINLNETNIFHYDSYAIWVHSEDHNPPHFHIRSKDNWDVCFYIQDGELYKVKSEGDNEQTFSYIMDNVKKWLSSESARVKGYTNQVNAMLAWDEIHDTHDFFDYPPQVPPQR